MPASRSQASFLAALAALIWGFTFLSIKIAVIALPPMTLGFSRFLVANIFLTFFFLSRRRLPKLALRDVPLMAASGLFGVTVYFLCENNGVLLLSASEASLIIGTIPVVTLMADRVILGTPLHRRNYIGASLSVVGVGLLVAESLQFSPSPMGYIYMLLAALSWVVYTFITQPLLLRYNRLEITFWQNVSGMLGFVPFLFFESPAWDALTSTVVLNVVYLGVFGSAIANLSYVVALGVLGPSTVNVYNNLIPVVSVIASFLILGERLTRLQLSGGVIAIAGVCLATMALRKKKAPPVSLP